MQMDRVMHDIVFSTIVSAEFLEFIAMEVCDAIYMF